MSTDIHLRVFRERSELFLPDGKTEIFFEGAMDPSAKKRLKSISEKLAHGYLERRITSCKDRNLTDSTIILKEEYIELLEKLVSAVTSEIGRALLALTILQLCVKAIEPEQNIRLHKGGTGLLQISDPLQSAV